MLRLVSEWRTTTAVHREYVSDLGGGMTLITPLDQREIEAAPIRETPRIHPGTAWAEAAERQGLADEYIDGMRNRYGERE